MPGCLLVLTAAVLLRMCHDMYRLKFPPAFVIVKTGEVNREVKPIGAVFLHALIFYWVGGIVSHRSWLFQTILRHANTKFDSWDVTFTAQNQDPATEAWQMAPSW